MIIRIQCSEGFKRIECQPNETLDTFFKRVRDSYSSVSIALYRDKSHRTEIKCVPSTTVEKSGLKHGDLLYLKKLADIGDLSSIPSTSKGIQATNAFREQQKNGTDSSVKSTPVSKPFANLKEDQVDVELWKSSGLIDRPKHPILCKHGSNAKCVNCVPIEPYDEGYLKEHKINHMSFHSYLRKMTTGIDKGKFAAVENISCKIKDGCKEHPPWPNGICTKCQPNAVTLSRQDYRHVDNVVFQNTAIVEQFINYWRTTGHQRIGLLYGFYEIHKDVPLGVKATVVAIYEPPQQSSAEAVRLHLPDDNQKAVDDIAAELGLQQVGWIFTDLVTQDLQKGTVMHTRGGDSYFLSAQECMMAGHFQTMHPNPCRLSPEGYFGSKYVTVVVTGDKNNQIHMEGYQVSNQCMALVRDNCLLPTKDAPELAYVKETTKEQYVPDVFFTEKDKFNNEIKQVARLLPVEYLLIDVPVSTPVEQKYKFNSDRSKKPFPIEHRMLDGHLQDFNALISYLDQFTKEQFLMAVNDFHFLIYIATMDMLPMADVMSSLLKAIQTNDSKLALEWSKSDKWATVEQLIAAQKPEENTNRTTANRSPTEMDHEPSPIADASSAEWPCAYCTFANSITKSTCEMCGLPKN